MGEIKDGLTMTVLPGLLFKKSIKNNPEGAMAAVDTIKNLVDLHLEIPKRLRNVVSAYLLSLTVESPKHTQAFASSLTGIHQSQFSRLLTNHLDLAVQSLTKLAQVTGRASSVVSGRQSIVPSAPWTVSLIIDATLHPRSSLHVDNAQRFNHGQGFVVGHQWTNVVIYVNGEVIPLKPIPFWSKNECKRRGVEYETEPERLVKYLRELNLAAIIGTYFDDEVVVLMDAGYDGKKLQKAVLNKGWDFLTALKSGRGSRSTRDGSPNDQSCRRVDDLFWATRKQAPWKTVRVSVDGGKKRRRFRARKLIGYLKGISRRVALVCTEKSGGTGRRYFACSRQGVDVGVIVRVYAKRWEVELFHREIKHQFGLLDAGVENFDTLTAHVHWAYCAYLLVKMLDLTGAKTSLEKQRKLAKQVLQEPWVDSLKRIIEAKTQCGGTKRQETLMWKALEDARAV